MSTLPKYFRDIPTYLMDEIITGMINGKMEPTPEEMDDSVDVADLSGVSGVSRRSSGL